MPNGPYLLMQSGQRFYLAEPKVGDFNIEDIAAGLSRICRFNGQIGNRYEDHIYSVAQHSVYVAIQLEQWGEHRAVPWGLTHDFPEYAYGDNISPLKELIPDLERYESPAAQAMREQFGIPYDDKIAEAVHKADKHVGTLEAKELTENTASHYRMSDTEESITALDPAFMPWRPREARKRLLFAYERMRTLLQ